MDLTPKDWLHVIATDCGLLSNPVRVGFDLFSDERPPNVLQIWPAERYEFVIDFSQYKVGDQVYLRNPNTAIQQQY